MTKQQINERLNGGLHCPICGMRLMDLAHDGYECGDADYHEYFCTECGLDITINADSCKEETENTTKKKYVIRHHWSSYVDIEVMASSEEEAYELADELYNEGEGENETDYNNTYVENVTELYN